MPSRSRSIRMAINGKKAVAGMLPRIWSSERTVCRRRACRKVAKASGIDRTTAIPTPAVTRRKLRRSVHGISRTIGPGGRSNAKCAARHPAYTTPAAKAAAASTASAVDRGPGRSSSRPQARKAHWPRGAITPRANHCTSRLRASQFDSGASRLPQRLSRAMLPSTRLRHGTPCVR